MPSPVGHALGGAIVWLVGAALQPRQIPDPRDVVSLESSGGGRGIAVSASSFVLCVAMAILPDIDFLWARHRMETHSIGAAGLAGLAALAWTRGRQPALALLVVAAWASHIVLDWWGTSRTAPVGLMALWPLSTQSSYAHSAIFEAISLQIGDTGFLRHNLWAVVKEMLVLGPLTLLAGALALWRQRPRRSGASRPAR